MLNKPNFAFHVDIIFIQHECIKGELSCQIASAWSVLTVCSRKKKAEN